MLFAMDGLPFNPGVAFDLTVAREWIGKLGIGSQGGPPATRGPPPPRPAPPSEAKHHGSCTPAARACRRVSRSP